MIINGRSLFNVDQKVDANCMQIVFFCIFFNKLHAFRVLKTNEKFANIKK